VVGECWVALVQREARVSRLRRGSAVRSRGVQFIRVLVVDTRENCRAQIVQCSPVEEPLHMVIKKILVPIDFSEHAEKALAVAVDLSRAIGASLHVVHVIPPVPYLGPPLAPGPAFATELRTETRKAFDEYMAGLKQRGIDATGTLVEGVAYAEVNRVAAEMGADVIVMGTHGRSGLEHALLGSVAERVVRTARIPVIVVPDRVQRGPK